MNLRDELLAIRAARSALTPDIVVEEAAAPDHPLHSHFEWDDSVAGQFWRRHQAGQLIRSVTITYTRQNGTQGKLREFHAVRDTNGHKSYEPFEELLQSPLELELVRRKMRRDWEAFRARYESFEEFRQLLVDYVDGQEEAS